MTAGMELFGRLVAAPRRRLTVILALAGLALAGATPAPASAARFQLGLQDGAFDDIATSPSNGAAAYQVLHGIGGSVVRLDVFWSSIAPALPAPGFQATNPADPEYRWTALDAAVRGVAAHHAAILLTMASAPGWAEGPNRPQGEPAGDWDPDPTKFAQFAQAVATRYSGVYPDAAGQSLPRAKYFEIWNEPNLPGFYNAPDRFGAYRSLLTAAYQAVKSVRGDNQVVMGGMAPVSYQPPATLSPLKFAAEMMCLRRTGTHFVRMGQCRSAPFDIFAEHPYTIAATPTEPAGSYDDVLAADVHKLRDLLNAAERLHTISGDAPPLWVTEWGWVTKPPDSGFGDSFATAGRYVAYAMYEMWKVGVSLVVWQDIRDIPAKSLGGDGLQTSTGRPKPSLKAFAFPFIASVAGGRGFAWGRAPAARRVRITVQRRTVQGWRRVARTRTGSDGVFSVRFAASGNATYRAQGLHAATSLSYYSAPIPPRFTHR